MEDILIEFQIYLNNKKLINNHDWEFEKEAKKFIKQRVVKHQKSNVGLSISELFCHFFRPKLFVFLSVDSDEAYVKYVLRYIAKLRHKGFQVQLEIL